MTNKTEGFAATLDSTVNNHIDEVVESNIRLLDEWRQKADFVDFLRWIESLFGSSEILVSRAVLRKGFHELPTREEVGRASFFTDSYRYNIVVRPNQTSEDSGYLGCVASCRKTRAGEDWTRGDDLVDGNYTEETWQRILADIVRHEMVALGQ